MKLCEFMVYRATLYTPAEWCPNEAEPGEDFCVEHLPPDIDPDNHWYEGDYE